MVGKLIDMARSDKKEGVRHLSYSQSRTDRPARQITYTRLFEPWGWSIGTGAYIDDIDATFRAQAYSVLWLFTGPIVLASIVTFVIGRNLARALNRLSVRVVSVAQGELDGEVPETERRDEVGVMARALLVLRDNSREAIELRYDPLTGLPNRKMLMDRLKTGPGRQFPFGQLRWADADRYG